MRHAASIARLIFLPSILSFPARVTAQQQTPPAPVQRARPLALPTLRPPVADTGTFSPLPFPPGNDRRTADGSPGPAYWQQYGAPNDGKGEPTQINSVSHGCSPARFRQINVIQTD